MYMEFSLVHYYDNKIVRFVDTGMALTPTIFKLVDKSCLSVCIHVFRNVIILYYTYVSEITAASYV